MILMRRGDRTYQHSIIVLIAAGTYVSRLKKGMKLFIRRYMSYSY